MRQRRITPRNPIRTTRQRRAHGASAGHQLYALRRCATSPSRRGASPSKKPPSSSVCTNGAMQKNRRRAVVYVIPRFANNLYNRSSAVDSSFYNQPQVGKPTWGYNYPTVLRRLPSAIIIGLRIPFVRHHPSNCANGAIHRHREKPPKSGLIC